MEIFGELGYLALLEDILINGTESDDRTGVGTRKVFGRMLKFDLCKSFPLLTTKRVPFRMVLGELLWMISGSTNIRPLVLQDIHIWNEWPLKHYLIEQGRFGQAPPGSEEWNKEMQSFTANIAASPDFAARWGELGPVYGYQWRHWVTPDGSVIDQLQNAIDTINKSPHSRRILVTAWNPADIDEMAISGLPPCHYTYQFAVAHGKLNCLMSQRSVDCFLGLPFNIASYALLAHIVANICGLMPGELTLSLADTHIYLNHIEQVKVQLQRQPYSPPTLVINQSHDSVDDYRERDFQLLGYKSHPRIKGEIAV